MTDIRYHAIVPRMIELLPELRLRYESELRWWRGEKPGPHIIAGDILTPYLREMVKTDKSGEAVQRICDFLEELANSSDMEVQSLLAYSVLEQLMSDEAAYKRARRFLGVKTLRLVDELRKEGR